MPDLIVRLGVIAATWLGVAAAFWLAGLVRRQAEVALVRVQRQLRHGEAGSAHRLCGSRMEEET